MSACGLQVDQRGRVGVVLGKVHVKLEAAVGVRGVRRARDQDLVERTQGEASPHLEKEQTEQKQHAVQSEQIEKESRSAEGKLSDWWGLMAATGNQPQSEVLISRSQQVYLHDVQSFLIAADEDAG